MTRGQNGSGGNCPPTLTRKTRPGFCLQEDGPGVPTPASQISLKSFCPGSLSGPAQGLDRQLHPHRGSVCATSRNPLIAPPTQELTAALSGQFHPHRLQAGSTSLPSGRRWACSS